MTLGHALAGETITIDVSDTELATQCDDGSRTVRRTTDPHRIEAPRARRIDP